MADEKTSRMDATVALGGGNHDPSADSAQVPTVVHAPNEPTHVSDVVLADSMSDVKLADSLTPSEAALADAATGAAPSFRAPTPPPGLPKTIELKRVEKRPTLDGAAMALLPGARVDDFEVVKLLGKGAFGHVYMARQISLDRLVALKVSANRGSEGRTMARLEHQHIVQVFAEIVDPEFDQRLLCMQLVPGVGLDKLISMLHAEAGREVRGARSDVETSGKGKTDGTRAPSPESRAPSPEPPTSDWTGAQMLAIIDRAGSLPMTLDPSALHDREALGKMDAVEATAWFGTRLAEALDFAHGHGVLHRDIKPANILVNPYGRPMLADFNISSQPVGGEQSGDELFGGTFAYMSPEHLDAFNPDHEAGHDAVTARSDIYSLGLVLQQLLERRVSLPQVARKGKMTDTLRAMAEDRRQVRPVCQRGLPSARMSLERSIGRCLEPKPEDRFASGADLGAQLDGCRQLRLAERKLPLVPSIFQPLLRHPFLWLVLLTILPQIAGSIVNITYNQTQIVNELDKPQQKQFLRLVLIYNAIVYPIAIVVFVIVVRRVLECWKALSNAERLPDGEVQAARRKALRLPRWIAGLTAFGWFPGGFLFPLIIQMTTPPLRLETAAHFVVSFVLSGLIALAYSLCGVEFIVLRALYPAMWRDTQNFTGVAREELSHVGKQLNRIELLAVMIPLLAAIVFVMLGNVSTVTFRAMVAGLIVLGILGFHITSGVTHHLSGVFVALTDSSVNREPDVIVRLLKRVARLLRLSA